MSMFATDQREACSPFREKGRGYYRTDRAKGNRRVLCTTVPPLDGPSLPFLGLAKIRQYPAQLPARGVAAAMALMSIIGLCTRTEGDMLAEMSRTTSWPQ